MKAADLLREKLTVSYAVSADTRGPWPITPSSFGTCLRALRLKLEEVPTQPNTEESERIFELGHQRGERLTERILGGFSPEDHYLGMEVPLWVPIPTDHATAIIERADNVFGPWYRDRGMIQPFLEDGQGQRVLLRGYADGVVLNPKTRHAILFDIKTTSSFGFGKLSTEGTPPPYLYQILAYREGLIYGGGVDSVETVMVYEAKDSDARRGHVGGELFFDQIDTLDDLVVGPYNARIKQIADLLEGWALGSVQPQPEFPLSGKSLPWQCNYCSIGPEAGSCYGETINKGTNKRKRYMLT